MPVLLGLILFIFSSDESSIFYGNEDFLFFPAVLMYCIVVFLWGNYEAAAASSRDVGQNTWDFQKMSAIGPWQLTLGKLFGSTSYVWYAGLILLGVMVFSFDVLKAGFVDNRFAEIYPTPLKPVIYLVFAGIMGHATALLLGVQSLKRNKSGTAVPFICGFIMSCTVLNLTFFADLDPLFRTQNSTTQWHSYTIDYHVFVISSLIFFFSWIMIAIQRMMRQELQYKNSPIVLMIFLVMMSLYSSGLLENIPEGGEWRDQKVLMMKLFVSFTIIMPCIYVMLLMEASDPVKYKRWFYALKGGEWKRVFENTPGWGGCLLLLLPVYGLLGVMIGDLPVSERAFLEDDYPVFILMTSFMLFAMRDGFMFHAILGGRIEKHKSFILMLYFFGAYYLLPFTLSSVFGPSVFYPWGKGGFSETCLPVLVQCGIAFAIMIYFLRRKSQDDVAVIK